jgi:hypothetical protein
VQFQVKRAPNSNRYNRRHDTAVRPFPMNADDAVRAWRAAADGRLPERPAPAFRFAALWVAFSARYASRHGRERGDWNQIAALAADADVVARHRARLSDPVYRGAVAAFQKKGVDAPGGRARRRLWDAEDVGAVFSCLTQLRANLFQAAAAGDTERLLPAGVTILDALLSDA